MDSPGGPAWRRPAVIRRCPLLCAPNGRFVSPRSPFPLPPSLFPLDRIQLLAKRLVPLDGVATNALIDSRRHAGQVRDLCLESRTPVSNSFVGAEQRGCNGVDPGERLVVSAIPQPCAC